MTQETHIPSDAKMTQSIVSNTGEKKQKNPTHPVPRDNKDASIGHPLFSPQFETTQKTTTDLFVTLVPSRTHNTPAFLQPQVCCWIPLSAFPRLLHRRLHVSSNTIIMVTQRTPNFTPSRMTPTVYYYIITWTFFSVSWFDLFYTCKNWWNVGYQFFSPDEM